MGAVTLQSHVVATFQLTEVQGREYLLSYAGEVDEHWVRFSGRMNQLAVDSSQAQRIVGAALETFEGLGPIFEMLYPVGSETAGPLAASLNPEAGRHPIPSDPRELEAAIRAGELCWRQFPYYEWRYGERGRRFASSDSAWLVTLSEHDQPVVDQQVRWLGQVLAARGMPQIMLETHLELLHEELVRAAPEKAGSYEKLLLAARRMAANRWEQVDQQATESLTAEFDAAVGSSWSERLPGIGTLLVAAVADEKTGVRNAVESLESWLTDPKRFPETWVQAVHDTIRKAR